jgi:hypothetical protein
MGKELAQLWVVVGAKTTDLNRELGAMEKDVRKTMGNIKKECQNLGIAFTAMGAAITAVLGKMVSDFAQTGDDLILMSQKTGIAVQSLSELKYVGDLNGITLDTLATSIKGMANFLETARNGSSAAAIALRQLHLSVSNLRGLSPEEMFMRLTSAIAGVPDPLTRSALAVDIFGKSGADLLPLLSQGSEGIQIMRDRANLLGVTMSASTAAGAMDLSDAFKDMKAAVEGLTNRVGEALAPALIWLIQGCILPIVEGIKNWIDLHPELFKWIMIVVGALGVLVLVFGAVLLGCAAIIAISPAMAAAWTLITGPIGLIVIAIVAVIAIIAVLVVYWEEVWNGIKWFTRTVVNFIINSVLGMVNSIVNIFLGMINGVIGLLNLLPGVEISKVATLNLHYDIPEFDSGGINMNPGLFYSGVPEAHIPLSKLDSMGGSGGGGRSGNVINVSFPNYLGSKDDVVNTIREGLITIQGNNVNAFG